MCWSGFTWLIHAPLTNLLLLFTMACVFEDFRNAVIALFEPIPEKQIIPGTRPLRPKSESLPTYLIRSLTRRQMLIRTVTHMRTRDVLGLKLQPMYCLSFWNKASTPRKPPLVSCRNSCSSKPFYNSLSPLRNISAPISSTARTKLASSHATWQTCHRRRICSALVA